MTLVPVEAKPVRTSDALREVRLFRRWFTCNLVVLRFFYDLNIVGMAFDKRCATYPNECCLVSQFADV